LKLHLGCGDIHLPGYINIDIRPGPAVDQVADARDLPWPDNSLDEIYACALLEHLGQHEWRAALAHWHAKLKPNGLLRVSVPDFRAICEWYLQTHSFNHLLGLVIGGQRDEYDYHKMIFDFNLLAEGLRMAGFHNIRRYDWRDTVVGDLDIDDFSQAYLPHMDKEYGHLMVLNVEARA